MFSDIKSMIIAQSKNKKECLQPALQFPMKKPANYDEFNRDFQKYGFDFVIKKYINNSFKVKIRKLLYKIGILNKLVILKRGLK